MINENPNLGDWVSEELKINKAQVVWAVRYEFARTVEDVESVFLSIRGKDVLDATSVDAPAKK